jgi:hypothetical protein
MKPGGAAFVQLVIPTRPVYVGESVPVDIELGLRANVVTSLNGFPALTGTDFTLNNLSKQPLHRDQIIDGSPFLVLTWHSALTVVKPGSFPLSVEAPVSVRVDARSDEDRAFGNILGWPFSQIPNKGTPPKEVTVASPAADLVVLPLPTQGRPKDFTGAVGDFQVSSEVSAAHVAEGDPLTLRLRISGAGNFDRVDSAMLDHLDHWKTYPPRSTFTPSDLEGSKGTKLFEEPLIAELAGEQSIPGLEFSYFNPTTHHYERARTQPIAVTVSASLADSSLGAPAEVRHDISTNQLARGLRADHPPALSSVRELLPLYFRAPFLTVPATLMVLFAGGWFALRSHPARASSKATARVLTKLSAAAQSGDSALFLETARAALLQTLANRWRLPPAQISSSELRARLGKAGEDVELLIALADEAKYSRGASQDTDFERWLGVVRSQLTEGAA